jgi:cellobiose phosphorylase
MYRLLVESLLGLKLEVNILRFTPCLPAHWKEFTLRYRYRETIYRITVLQTQTDREEMQVTVDGMKQDDGVIHLVDDHREHTAEVKIHSLDRRLQA